MKTIATNQEGWYSSPPVFAILLVVITLVAYLPTLRGGFLWDDEPLITQNRMIKTSDGLYRLWFTTDAQDYYPLTGSLWWLEWRLWRDRAAGYHVVNVLFHAVNVVLVWVVLRRLKIPGAWLAALVFGIHPVNVATVAWISEQKNTLSMLFYAATILLYLQFYEDGRWRWYGFSLVAFLLALFSKAAVVMLPMVLLGCVWWMRGQLRREDLLRSAPFFVLSLLLGLVTIWFQHHRALRGYVIRSYGFFARVAAAGWVPWFYLYKALLPVNLTLIYPKWPIDASRWVSYVPGALLVFCFIVLYRKRETWGRPLLFGLGYFVVTLFPVWGFFDQGFYSYSLVADHWQYYSIIGVIAVVIAAGEKFSRRLGDAQHYWGTVAAVVLLTVLGAATWQRSCVYASAETLWQDTLSKNPQAWVAQLNLGNAVWRAGRIQDALLHYEQALQIKPDYAGAHLDLGAALIKLGRPEDAIRHYEQAVQIAPDSAEAHRDLGVGLERLGRVPEAIGHYEKALEIDPDFAETHNDLGNALLRLGKIPEGIEQYEQALKLNPGSAETHINLGGALSRQGKFEEAIFHYTEALRIKPGSAEAHNNLGGALERTGKFPEAMEHYEQALRLKPDYADAHYNLGAALERLGRVPEAIGHYEQALLIKPDYTNAGNNLAWLLATREDSSPADREHAVQLAEHASRLAGEKDPQYLDTLAAAYAASGKFPEAIVSAQKAIELARATMPPQRVQKMEARLELYRNGHAYRRSVDVTTPNNL